MDSGNAAGASGDTILFVDDETNILNSIKRELHDWLKANSLRLITATSAREGLELLETEAQRVAVLVSDLRMPEMKGSDFLLAAKEKWPSIITILLTGFPETEEIMKAVKAGIFSYILKPWDADYLRSEVEKALATYRLKRQNEAYAKTMEEELRWAGEMQRAMLKPNLLRSEGVEFRTSYRPLPSLYCGGDYYDVISIGADRFLILVGDVAGHGLKGALVTGILKAVIFPEFVRGMLGKKFSPAGFLSWLNERMNFELRQASDLIITFLAGVLDRREMTFTYANAGQDHPFIVSGGQVRELPVSGSAIGFAGSVMYADKIERLLPGDVIFAFSDGLVEAGAKRGAAPTVRLKDILASTPYGSEYHKRILEAALSASGAADFEDDVTIVTAALA